MRPATRVTSVSAPRVTLGQAGEKTDGQQGQDVVHDGRAQDDAGEGSVEHAHLGEHAAGDADAGGREGQADERSGQDVLTDGQADTDARDDGQDEADGTDRDGHGTDLEQVVEAHLQTDREEQDDHAQLSEDLGRERDVGQTQREGADDEAAEQLTDDTWLIDTPEDLFADLGCEEEDEQAEQRVRKGCALLAAGAGREDRKVR